jgi:hypothetical protein
VPAFALGVIGIGPSLVVHHGPERLALDHGEIADDRDQDMLDALIMQCTRQMMVVDDVMVFVRPKHDRDHVLAEQLGAFLFRFVLPPALALLLYLPQADRHLGRTQ